MTSKVFLRDSNDGSALADNTPATVGNTGASAVNAVNGGTCTWKADTQFGGSWSVECVTTTTANSQATIRIPFLASTRAPGIAFVGSFPSIPTDANAVTLFNLRRASGVLVSFQVNQTGQIQVLVNSVAMAAPKTSTNTTPAAVTAGGKYRVEIWESDYLSNGTTGKTHVRLYAYGADVNTYLAQTDNNDTAMTVYTVAGEPFTHAEVGVFPTASNVARTMRVSNLVLDDAAAAFMGPYVASVSATVALSPTSGPVPRTDGSNGTEVTATITPSSTSGLAASPYAILVEFSAIGDFTDTVTYLDTRGTYQVSPVFKFTPPNRGTEPDQYRVTGYVMPAA